jgi:SAM-dependent methyltransferase
VRIVVTPFQNEMGKFSGIANAFKDIWEGNILDVGCRSGNLASYLPGDQWSYYGVDLSPPAKTIANLEHGLPFPDGEFSTVVALDILEHTEKIHFGFQELCRVSKRFILLSLPNTYDFLSRVRFLLGRHVSGKYGLPVEPIVDRHRWLLSWNEGRRFVHTLGGKLGYSVRDEISLLGPKRGALFGSYLARRFPNLISPWYIALLERV